MPQPSRDSLPTELRADASTADELQRELLISRGELEAERGRLVSMRGSWSWRVTLPLRIAGRILRRWVGPKSPSESAAQDNSPTPFLVRFAVDIPSVREFAPGQIRFYGWCLGPNDSPPSAFRIRAGRQHFSCRIKIPRPDVLAVLGVPEESLGCGFDAFVDIARGPTQIALEAQFEGIEAWRTIDEFDVIAADEAEGYDAGRWRTYRKWLLQHDQFDGAARDRLAARCAAIQNPITISVLLPAWNTPEPVLRAAIESVRRQVYPHWQLCIADDASPSPHVRGVLAEYSRLDSRIAYCVREEQGNISLATNSALDLATGQWVAFLDHDDELHPAALGCIALEVDAHPEAEMIYSDEDKVDADQRRSAPHLKPEWDAELLVGQNYVCHLVALPRKRMQEIGGLRAGLEGCQDWDLVLRATEANPRARVRHIPRLLYHWRIMVGSTALGPEEKDYVSKRAFRALREHFERTGEPIEDITPIAAGLWRVIRTVPAPAPPVSVIVPTRDKLDLLERCILSLRQHTRYPNFEIVVVDNQSAEPATIAKLREWQEAGIVRVIPYDAPFNYAALHNLVVPQCAGEFVCLLNNDTEVIEPDWLTHLMAQAVREGVGAVGALLLYPDQTIQHAGTILGLGGIGDHRHALEPRYCEGHMGRLRVAHQISAVTGACLVVRKSSYLEAGGMDEENLAVTYNDVDFCLRLIEHGYRNIWTPLAVLIHHESASRGLADTPEKRARFRRELQYMRDRWGERLLHDPAYNPNCTLQHKDGGLAAVPRLEPW